MQARIKSVDQLQKRATTAEEELDRVRKEPEVIVGLASALTKDKERLEEDNGTLHRRVDRRNAQLNLTRKQKWKAGADRGAMLSDRL